MVDSVAEEAKVVVSRRIVRDAAVFRRAQQNLTNSDDADCSFRVGFGVSNSLSITQILTNN